MSKMNKCTPSSILPSQTAHRTSILSHAPIKDGDRIFEIGCGQGDCTWVLASLYPNSHVTAIDPAPPSYGAPITLGEAQERIKTSEVGGRITFVCNEPIKYLENVEDGAYDVAVMCHSLWYFASKAKIEETFAALRGKVKKLFIAEWALQSSVPEGNVHVSTALATALCEAYAPSGANIQTLVSPGQIADLAAKVGWRQGHSSVVVPEKELEDGWWEVAMLLQADDAGENQLLKRANGALIDEKIVAILESVLEGIKKESERIGGKRNVRSMDVWVGSFEG